MKTQTLPTDRSTPTSRDRPGSNTVFVLGWTEGRRLLAHPVLWLGTLLSGAWMLRADGQLLPILHRDVIREMPGLLPLLGASLLAAGLMASRTRRAGLEDLINGYETSASTITAAQLGAALVTALPAVVLLFGDMAILRFAAEGSGAPHPLEALVWPAAVVVCAWLGIAIERWTRSTIAGFLGVLGVAVTAFLVEDPPGRSDFVSGWRTLGLWTPLETSLPELSLRRPGLHLLYLASVAGLVATAALAKHGLSRRLVAGLLVTSCTVFVTGWAQARPPSPVEAGPRWAYVARPDIVQECEETALARYCSYPAYGPWRARWQAVVEPILDAVPSAFRTERLEVSQRPIGDLQRVPRPLWTKSHTGEAEGFIRRWRSDGAVHPDREWSRSPHDAVDQFDGLAIEAVAKVVGFVPPAGPPPDGFASCHTMGQARTVLALWLAGSATEGTEAQFRRLHGETRLEDLDLRAAEAEEGNLGPDYGSAITSATLDATWFIEWPRLEAEIALRLLDRPRDEVLTVVRQDWDRLVDPATPTQEAMELFRVPIPAPYLELQTLDVGVRCG